MPRTKTEFESSFPTVEPELTDIFAVTRRATCIAGTVRQSMTTGAPTATVLPSNQYILAKSRDLYYQVGLTKIGPGT